MIQLSAQNMVRSHTSEIQHNLPIRLAKRQKTAKMGEGVNDPTTITTEGSGVNDPTAITTEGSNTFVMSL